MAEFWNGADWSTKDATKLPYNTFERLTRVTFLKGDCLQEASDGGVYKAKAHDPLNQNKSQANSAQNTYQKQGCQFWDCFIDCTQNEIKCIRAFAKKLHQWDKLPDLCLMDIKKLKFMEREMGGSKTFSYFVCCCFAALYFESKNIITAKGAPFTQNQFRINTALIKKCSKYYHLACQFFPPTRIRKCAKCNTPNQFIEVPDSDAWTPVKCCLAVGHYIE